jgi:predicted phage terminase large subunit-like protein
VSRALPAWFLGECRALEPDVILTGYGSGLVASFSRACQRIVEGWRYRALYPTVRIAPDQSSVPSWRIEGSAGEVTVEGLGGAITGRGGALIVLDDFCKRRAEAESTTYRANVWDSFSNDLMSRRAPVSLVVVAATPWHVDDLFGRIRREMAENKWFPRFEFLTFPARKEGEGGWDYLFPERFGPEWYATQRATLGKYAAAGLLDCAPIVAEGNLFKLAGVKYHEREGELPDCPLVRFWDLASTAKQRTGHDPDYTVGALVGVTYEEGRAVPHLWVKDLVIGQWDAPERNRRILAAAERDGPGVRIGVEAVAGYADAAATLREVLRGVRSVEAVTVSKDKVVRASALEPVFEAGNVHAMRAPWNDPFHAQFASFPRGDHDDVVDAVVGGFGMAERRARAGRGDGPALLGLGPMISVEATRFY